MKLLMISPQFFVDNCWVMVLPIIVAADAHVSDIRMPVMDGYEFIKRVKQLKADVKVFCMSAISQTIFNIQ